MIIKIKYQFNIYWYFSDFLRLWTYHRNIVQCIETIPQNISLKTCGGYDFQQVYSIIIFVINRPRIILSRMWITNECSFRLATNLFFHYIIFTIFYQEYRKLVSKSRWNISQAHSEYVSFYMINKWIYDVWLIKLMTVFISFLGSKCLTMYFP